MKRSIRRILKRLGAAALAALAAVLCWRLLYGRVLLTADRQSVPAADVAWAQAVADGMVSHEEVAVHYAPEIDAAVNVLLSGAGRGDFITAVDYDGDWSTLNNWEHMNEYPLRAVVYYSVQETNTHWFAGYYFYHPRDDAEIWLDRHENDMEGVMLAIPKAANGFLPPEYMYAQGHGLVPFSINRDMSDAQVAQGNRDGGGMLLEGDRVVVYIAPNGTLDLAGHSVESGLAHSTYWSVGNSGVRYYHGGIAQEPVRFNGAFTDNRCSYALRPLDELWDRRNGPYGDDAVFGQYGAFRGDNWGTDKANPPWGWRNKTIYGFGGSFLSDPVWTINRAIDGAELSADYVSNGYADWLVSAAEVVVPEGTDASACTLHIIRDGWEFSNPAWFRLQETAPGRYAVVICDEGRIALYAAAPENALWRAELRGPDGKPVPGASVAFEAEYRK